MNARHNQARRPDRGVKRFSVFWPDSAEGSQVWVVILLFMAFVSGLVEYGNSTDRYYRFERHLPGILVSMASSALSSYVILVIVRYVIKYFSSPRHSDGGYADALPKEYFVSSEIRHQAGDDQYRGPRPVPRHVVVEVPPVPTQDFSEPPVASAAPSEVASVSADTPPAPVPVVKRYVAANLPQVAAASGLDRKQDASVNAVKEAGKLSWRSLLSFVIWVCAPLCVVIFVVYSVFDSTGNVATTETPSSPIVRTRPGDDLQQVVNRAFVVTMDDQVGDRHPSFFLDVSANSDFRDWFLGSRYREVENLKLEGLMGASAFFVNSSGDTSQVSVFQFGTEDLVELVRAAGDRNGIFVDDALETRTWEDTSGKFKRHASFAGRSGNAVFLLYGSPIPSFSVVPFDSLSKADQAYINSQILTISAGPRAE